MTWSRVLRSGIDSGHQELPAPSAQLPPAPETETAPGTLHGSGQTSNSAEESGSPATRRKKKGGTLGKARPRAVLGHPVLGDILHGSSEPNGVAEATTVIAVKPPLGMTFDGGADVGFVVTKVKAGSNADNQRIKVGMEIVAVNALPVVNLCKARVAELIKASASDQAAGGVCQLEMRASNTRQYRRSKRASASAPAGPDQNQPMQWEVKLHGSKGKWCPFSKAENSILVRAKMANENKAELRARGFVYLVDFDALTQLNTATGKLREVRLQVGDATGLPTTAPGQPSKLASQEVKGAARSGGALPGGQIQMQMQMQTESQDLPDPDDHVSFVHAIRSSALSGTTPLAVSAAAEASDEVLKVLRTDSDSAQPWSNQ